MDGWQGKDEPHTPRAGKSRRNVRSNEPDQDSWMPGASGGMGSSQPLGHESWSHIPARAVNWVRFRYRTKLAGLALVALALTGFLLYVWIYWWGEKTNLVLIKPAKLSADWLATTPYQNSLTRDSLVSSAKYLKPFDELDLLDPASDDWKKLQQDRAIRFGGPDGQVLLFYINAVCVASGPEENDDADANLTPYILPADVSPFDSNGGMRRFPLEDLLDQIVACDSGKSGTKIVLIDSQPLRTPANPGLLLDRFPQAVHDLYERKYKNGPDPSQPLVIISSHSPGQRNWPAPELESSVFGYFTRAALLGAADGATGNGQDDKITLAEFCQYVASHVAEHVGKYRLASQDPMILAPASLIPAGNETIPSAELALTYCKPSSAVADSTNEAGRLASERIARVVDKYRLPQKWEIYAELESSQRLDRDPLLAGRLAALLSRMEQLVCELGVDSDELVKLETEWTSLIQSIDKPKFFSPVSLAEAEWLDQQEPKPGTPGNSNPALLPNGSERIALQQTLSGWVKLQKSPSEKPAADPAVKAENADAPAAEPGSDKPKDEPKGEPQGESKEGATTPDSKPAEVAAQEPNPEAEEIKKRLLEIERQPWLMATMLWDGACGNGDFSPGLANLEHWLTKLDEVSAPMSGGLAIHDCIEMKFLHLLLQNVDWKSAPAETIEPAVRRAVQCRQACEYFAIHVDPRVLIWVSDEFRQLEDTRRIAEDYLFANQFETAVKLFDSVLEQLAAAKPENLAGRAKSLANAFAVRNEVARKSPFFAMLIARQILRSETTGKDVPAGIDFVQLRDRWLTLAQLNHQLAYELWRPTTVIEEATTVESIRRNTEKTLGLAREVQAALDFLEGQLGEQRNYLADIKTDDTQALVYIPDLLLSPLVTTRREDLREQYLKSIRSIAPDVGSGRKVQPVNVAYTNEPQQAFQEFLRSAELVNQQDVFTPLQRSISAKPYRKSWETARISPSTFEEIEQLLEKEIGSADSLPGQRSALQNSDYWLRCIATGLADYPRVVADSRNRAGDHFDVWGRTGSALDHVQESLHTNFKIERILEDFWGNNQVADPRDPYFQRVATEIYDRLGEDAVEHRKLLDRTLQPLFASRLNSAREFQIACDDYRYLRNEAEEKPHAYSVRANAELDQRAQVDGMDLRPIAIAQLQLRGRRLSHDPVSINAINESGALAERRIAFDLEKLRSGDLPNQPFYFSPESLPTLGNVQAILSFRGHLADALFAVRALDRPPPDSMPTVTLAHKPSSWRAPTVLVNSDERAVTDVVFVLDCSYSMSGGFGAGELEGSSDPLAVGGTRPDATVSTTRFDFLKSAIVYRLSQMRTSKLNRVGIVAVGSRVKFRKEGAASFNELVFSDPDQAKQWTAEEVRPNNDARIISDLTSTAVWSNREWEEIEDAINNLKPFGQTPLYAGMRRATEMLNASGDNRAKVIVVISDGVEEVYEFNGALPELDDAYSMKNYQALRQILPANKIQVFFVGFDLANDQSKSAQEQKSRLDKIQSGLFGHRLDEIKSLATKMYFPSQIQEFRNDLDEIARASQFLVSRRGAKIAEAKLNQSWQPPGLIEQFEPGFYDISIQDTDAAKSLWLEDGEFITLGFDGSDLRFAKGKTSSANVIESVTQNLGRDEYSVSLFQPNLQRPDMIPFEFLFERIAKNEFSFRPNRLCLEILPSTPSPEALAYVLQDYRFVNKTDQNAPVVQFASPGLEPGSYTLRLWSQPFQESRDAPPGQMSLTDAHLNGRAGALKQELQIDDGKVAIEAWGDSAERSITIKLTSDHPEILRTLLVDLFVDDSPSKARNGIDFAINRVFAKPVLVADSSEKTASTLAFVDHVFFLDNRYHALPIKFTVRPMNSIFGKSDFSDFSFHKD